MNDTIPPAGAQPNEQRQHTEWPYQPQPEKMLPYSAWWAVVAGALTGVFMRTVVFDGEPGSFLAPMTGSFMHLVPLLTGAVTVFVAEHDARRSWGYYAAAGALASMFFVIGTLLVMVEGLVCAVVTVPLFMLSGAAGGLIMGAVCRLTVWAKQTLFGLIALPLVVGSLTGERAPPDHFETVYRTLSIHAPAQVIWDQIHNTVAIDPARVAGTWVYAIGVPKPTSGISRATTGGHVRHVELQRGAHFDQEFLEWQPYQYARWRYRFTPDSFPPGTLDEHVVISGRYFDLLDGELRLDPQGATTQVTLGVRYRVSTQFNWYAILVARVLMGNLEQSILEYYRDSTERCGRACTPAGDCVPAVPSGTELPKAAC